MATFLAGIYVTKKQQIIDLSTSDESSFWQNLTFWVEGEDRIDIEQKSTHTGCIHNLIQIFT